MLHVKPGFDQQTPRQLRCLPRSKLRLTGIEPVPSAWEAEILAIGP